jgi:DUF4097 and DUF4098 domain-containing protein YvlB
MKRPIVIALLIVALLFVGAGIMAVIFFGINQGFDRFSFDENRVSVTAEESKNYSSEGVTRLEVKNDAGNVYITGGDVSQVTVEASKTAWGMDETGANTALKDLKYTVKQNGDALVVTFEQNPRQEVKNKLDTIDFVITVPHKLSTTVKVQFGTIKLNGTEGDANLDSAFGDIAVENLKGGLTVNTESGSVVTISISAGSREISLQSGFGNLTLEKVSASDLIVESESGAIKLDDVRASDSMELFTKFGSVSFEKGSADTLTVTTESGKVELTSLQISESITVTDKFGNISLEQVDATSYDLDTESGAIEVDGVSYTLKAHSGFGNITIKNGENASIDLDTESGTVIYEGTLGDGPHKLNSNFGEIRLVIPADAALNVDLKTEFGKIKSVLPITITVTGNVESDHFVGTINGGGGALTATTQSGSISLEILSK